MSEVQYELADGVAVLSLSRGETNALSPTMRADLAAALDRAAGSEEVRAVVLIGEGNTFSSGIDLSEYDGALAAPWVDALTRKIETCPKPVIAVMDGAALGAGFELALAAHARVARRGCRVALPEVSLGLMPSGGSTQRLPRLLGAQVALELLLSGRAVEAADPRLAKLFADLTEGDPLETGLAVARRFAQAAGFPRTGQIERGFSDPTAYRRSVSEVAARITDEDGAEADILRCVEAAQLLPYDQGLAFEAAAFEARMARTDTRAARHLYAAERRAAAWPEAREGSPRKVATVVLAGSDPVLSELAVHCLDKGQRVAILAGGAAGEAVTARARAVYEGAVARKRMAPEERDARLARLSRGSDPSVLMAADLVLDGGGDLNGAVGRRGAVWCMVSGRDGAAARRAQQGSGVDVLAMRAYRPAHSLPLVELAVPEGAAADAVMTVVGYFGGPARAVLRSADRPGMIGHRLMGAVQRAAMALMAAGADAPAIEAAARSLGFARGPLEIIEMDGIGVVVARLRRIFGSVPELSLLEARADAVAAGKTPGQGFFAPQGQALAPDPGLADWLRAWRDGKGGGGPDLPDVPLERALHAAVVAEAARMIADGTVSRASDIDLCMVRGYGFDKTRGGPLLWADLQGVLGLVRSMKALMPLGEALWTPPASLEEMVKFGRRFFGPGVS